MDKKALVIGGCCYLIMIGITVCLCWVRQRCIMICTNNTDLFNYLQAKGVHCIIYHRPIEGDNILNIWLPETHNITICGNRYNQQRIESGDMKREFEQLKKLVEMNNTIVITPITLFNGVLHAQLYPNSMSNVKRQRIHTARLGELVYPHFIHIYGAELKPVTDVDPKQELVNYGNCGKYQQDLYWNVFYNKTSKEERRKKRYIPEYALFSQLYKQIIKEGK